LAAKSSGGGLLALERKRWRRSAAPTRSTATRRMKINYAGKIAANWSKEVAHVTRRRNRRSPPRPSVVRPLALDELWSLLTDEQRHRTLVTLSGIVLRQLDAPRDDREVRNELS